MRTIALSLVALAAAGVAATVIVARRQSHVVNTPDGGKGAPAWPPPHAHLRTLASAVDEKYPDVLLRVVSTTPRDPKPLRDQVVAARALYPEFLKAEGVKAEMVARPLNLAIVPQAFLNRADLWPDVKPGSDYPTRYKAQDATLYIADTPGFESSDLTYGIGLHLCAPLPLSDAQCADLADRFEHYVKTHAR
jgi:hypothetical protein